jgi:hypothetical protein
LGSFEDELVKWLKACDDIHANPTKAELQAMAKRLAAAAGVDPAGIGGKDWFRAFVKRHPELSVRRGQLTESARLTAMNRPSIARYFELLRVVTDGVQPNRIYNVDEVGIDLMKAGDKVS